ncbi:hypothetical protein [Marinobacter sp.]|uniref:hypothetical protein n=1 Tax=Marinobacter sp. TaxID=50741 RepID=UPI0035662F10
MTKQDLLKAQRLSRAILLDILSNDKLKKIDNFSELHDHVDANCLGGVGQSWHWLHDEENELEILNEAQNMVNRALGVINAKIPADSNNAEGQ